MRDERDRETGTVLLYARTSPYRLGASYARAFRELGWRVVLFDSDPAGGDLVWWLQSRIPRRLTRQSMSARRWGSRRRNRSLVRRAREVRPDLVLLIGGRLVMPETVARLKESGATVALFHPDAPVPGNANHRPEHLPVIREADVCFIWSRHLKERLEDSGAGNVVYLPFAWDPYVFPHVEDPAGDGPEVVFVGGWDAYREEYLEPVAKRFDLEIWGPEYWGTRTRPGSPVRDCWQGRALRGSEAAEAVVRAKISLNVLREQNLPDGTNMRTFEVPGAGGFQLATRTSGAEEIYPEGEAGVYFESVGELLRKITLFLEKVDSRRQIEQRGHELTVRFHTYLDRAKKIIADSVRS